MDTPSPEKETHFLIVDDDAESRSTIEEYLREMGHTRISQAENGALAYKLIERDASINFIISDWEMPTMGGLDLLQKVKASATRAHLPFLIMTSPISQESEKVILAAENLVDAYLIKPFRSNVLKDKIQTILETPVRGPTKRAVVVDDDDDAREMVIEYLKLMGFKDLVSFKNGAEAITYLMSQRNEVGLIVSDWEMPEMSGLELLRACKNQEELSKIPFVMVTSQSSIERMKVMQAAKANVDQYVLKPFNSSELKKRVEQVIDKARSRNLVQALVGEALNHVEYNRFQRAQQKFEEALRLDPTQDIALIGLGDVLLKIKTVDEAIPYFRRAVEVTPLNPKAYLRLAVAFEQLGWFEKAMAVLQTAIQHISFNAELHFHLGRIYNKRDMLIQARGEFEKALQIQLDHKEARLMLEMIVGRTRSEK
jgi:two-component system, chemotaxis family, chemotaxis protein CheY